MPFLISFFLLRQRTCRMKPTLIGVFLSVLLAVALCEEPCEDVVPLSEQTLVGQPKAQLIYKLINKFMDDKIATLGDVVVGDLDLSFIGFQMSDIHILGLDQMDFNIQETASGFNIDNMTLFIPEATFNAGNYKLSDLSFGCFLTLNGDGPLKVTLKNFLLTAKIDISYKSAPPQKFTVEAMPIFEYFVEDIKFELGNLIDVGENRPSPEELSKMISKIVLGVVRGIMTIMSSNWGGYEKFLSNVVQGLLNNVLHQILPPPPEIRIT